MSLAAREHHRRLVSITCAQTIVMASAWVGFTFPGMIEEPGSFSGRDLAEPQAWPRHQPQIVGDLEETGREAPCARPGEHQGVMAGERLELVPPW